MRTVRSKERARSQKSWRKRDPTWRKRYPTWRKSNKVGEKVNFVGEKKIHRSAFSRASAKGACLPCHPAAQIRNALDHLSVLNHVQQPSFFQVVTNFAFTTIGTWTHSAGSALAGSLVLTWYPLPESLCHLTSAENGSNTVSIAYVSDPVVPQKCTSGVQ